MWKRPWSFSEGLIVGFGLFFTGLLLQNITEKIDWTVLAWPVNIGVLILYLFLLTGIHLLRKRVYVFNWLSHYTAAVSSLLWVAGITIVMGLIRQVQFHQQVADPFGFSQMLSSWPFALLYLYMVTTLGLTLLRAGFPIKWKKIPFWLNHAGLFIALITATLGHADMQRLEMTTQIGKTEWRATDKQRNIIELPLAIELQDFTIDEYPPKLMLIDNETGKALPTDKPQHLLLESDQTQGLLQNWQIKILQFIPQAASVATEDTLKFVDFHSIGSTCAVYLTAYNTTQNIQKEGWVSCGSFLFPYKALQLDLLTSLVMPEREPQRFASAVKVYTQNGQIFEDTIEVNHPLSIAGWDIYQLSYDESKGKWSDISIFELVRDPWLPAVYIGIWMLIAGAISLFVSAQKRKEEK